MYVDKTREALCLVLLRLPVVSYVYTGIGKAYTTKLKRRVDGTL